MAGLGLARCRTQLGLDLCLGAEPVLEMLALGPVFTLPDEVGAPLDFRSDDIVHLVHDVCVPIWSVLIGLLCSLHSWTFHGAARYTAHDTAVRDQK